MEDQLNDLCRNCQHPLLPDAKFCPNCSQKNTDGRFTFRELWENFAESIFSFDTRIFQTLRDLAVPGKLTERFFQGKHVRYYHPVRLFVISAAIMITAITLVASKAGISEADSIFKNYELRNQNRKLLAQVDSLTDSLELHFPAQNLTTPLDTLQDWLVKKIPTSASDSISVSIGFSNDQTKYSVDDLIDMPTDSLAKKYHIDNFWGRMALEQNLRIFQSPSSFITYFIGNTLWMVLVMMPLLALALKLMYLRRHFLYYEHLIFSFHVHTFLFLTTTVLLLLQMWLGIDIVKFALLPAGIYPLLAMKRFYQEKWRWTILKFFITSLLYMAFFILALSIVTVVSIFLF